MKILIAGGSGLIGTKLLELLKRRGHQVSILSRNPQSNEDYSSFKWDIEAEYVDEHALEGIDVLINLAGAGIADARWSDRRKEVLRASRVEGNKLLLEAVQASGTQLNLFVGASAIGVYGNRGDHWLTEESKPGDDDFLVSLSKEWEASHRVFLDYADRIAILRIGVVLSMEGGALPKLNQSVVIGSSGYLGDGAQYMSWIHIDDLTRIFLAIIENPELSGIINATSPHPVTNKKFMETLVSLKSGLGILLPVPAFLLKIYLGEMSQVVLDSSRVSPDVLVRNNYEFKYERLEDALNDLKAI